MKIRLRFATFEQNGTPRISMSRDELLAMLNSLDKDDKANYRLIRVIEALERELLAA